MVTALRGPSIAGYAGYLDGKLAPMALNLLVQQQIAFRWLHGKKSRLGEGVPFATTADGTVVGATGIALATTSSGTAVGASAPPGAAGAASGVGDGTTMTWYRYGSPHAMLWPRAGSPRRIVRDDERSVAWDVSDDGTIAGIGRLDGVPTVFLLHE